MTDPSKVVARYLSAADALNMDDFVKAVEAQTKIGDRQLRVQAHADTGQVFVTLINLPKGLGSAGGGAEAMNNRVSIKIEGWQKGGTIAPDGKVKAETMVPGLDRNRNRIQMRAKSGPPQAVAKYVADYISGVVKNVLPNFTHSKPPEGYEA